jgi:hypothetical protein
MNRGFIVGVLFTIGIIGVYLIISPDHPASSQAPELPTETVTPVPTPTMVTMLPLPTETFQASTQPVEAAPGITLGWTGHVECYNCAPFSAKAKLSNYDPNSGPDNCWDYDEKLHYCFSPTKMDVPWKSIYGIGAACPFEWPYGTWVEVPGVGAFICFDRGGSIKCDPHTKICNVDIMGPGGADWQQQVFDVTLWVPLDPPRPSEGK